MVRKKGFLQSFMMSMAFMGMINAIMDVNFFITTIVAILITTAIIFIVNKDKDMIAVVIILILGIIISWKLNFISIKDCWNHIAKAIEIRFKMWIPIWNITDSKMLCMSTQAFVGVCISIVYICTVRFKNQFFIITIIILTSVLQILFGNQISSIYFGVLFISCLWSFGYGLIFIAMIACCIVTAFLPQKSESLCLKNIQKNLVKSVESICYGEDASGLLEGDFTNITGRKVEDKTALQITMQKPNSVYLRGFIGEKFLSNQWVAIDGVKQYDFANLFYWFHKEDFYTQGQLKKAFDAFEINKKSYKVLITPKYASRKYRYIPYEYSYDNDETISNKTISDGTVYNKGKSEYQYKISPGLVTDYPKVLDGLLQGKMPEEYCRQEKSYNHYVYETYLDLEKEEQTLIKNSLGGYQLKNETHYSYKKAKETILNYLSKNMTYNEEISSNEKEFLKEFLKVKKTGYDIHYATAATLMFRYYKIPARYVEGYLITPSDVKNMKANTAYNLPLANAHAWVEYYQDGVGWIPFEVTPPYVGVMDKAKILTKPNSSNVPTPQTQKKQTPQEKPKPSLLRQKVDFNKFVEILPAFFFGLLSALIWGYIFRAVGILTKRRIAFKQEDNDKAIIAFYSYMMEMLFSHSLVRENKSLAIYGKDVEKYETGYEEIINLYRKARFSPYICEKEEREIIENYMRSVNKKVYHSLKWYQKIKWRFWEFME